MGDPIAVKINGEFWDKPTNAFIERSVETLSGYFQLQFPQFADKNVFGKIDNMGSDTEIFINDRRIIKGFIERIQVVTKHSDKYVIISGRDSTGDLVDCNYVTTPNEWKKRTVLQIIKDLCSPFSISVSASGTAQSAANSVVDSFKATEGMTVHTLISQLCVDNFIMPISFGDGKLTLVRAEDAKSIGEEIQNPGKGTIGVEFIADDTDRFAQYVTRGQGIDTPSKSLTSFLQPEGTASDSIIRSVRKRLLFPENPTTKERCEGRSVWEARYRAGKSREFQYTLVDWFRKNGEPWPIHALVDIDDDDVDYSGEMYISSVAFVRRDSSDTSVITVVSPSTFSATGSIKKVVVD